MPPDTSRCRQCGGPKPPGQGRKYCSPECAALGPADAPDRRVCPECGESRIVGTEFRVRAQKCEACHAATRKAYTRAYYEANKEKVRAASKAYRDANKEKVNARHRAHYEENREAIRATQAAYYRANVEAQKERSHRWYEANKEAHKMATASYRIAHREKVRANNRRWYQVVKADPTAHARRLEEQRMNERLRRERIGRPMKLVPEGVYVKRYGRGHMGRADYERVDAEPIRELLLSQVDDIEAFADGAGLSASYVSRIIYRHIRRLTIRDADLLCVALNLPMALVYADQVA